MKTSSLVILLSVQTAASFVVRTPSVPFVANGQSSSTSLAMAEVTTALIKELRESTGAGMMDCKRALVETEGDMETAAENLRKKGLAKADKKASRVAAEGKIVVGKSGDRTVLVEVNSETDFVAKDDTFAGFAEKVAATAASLPGDDVDALLAAEIEDGETVETARQALVAKIGENIQVRRMVGLGGEGSTVGNYVHNGKIGVLVELEGGSEELAKDLAMHVAAMNPGYVSGDDFPPEQVEKEKQILVAQAAESGKPPEIVEKMVMGRLRKFLDENSLVGQTFVKTNDKTVAELLKENDAKCKGFTRVVVGEGIEKKEDDFAAEVAKMAGGN